MIGADSFIALVPAGCAGYVGMAERGTPRKVCPCGVRAPFIGQLCAGDYRALEQFGGFCHGFDMSTITAQLLEQFEKLPLEAQKEFSDAILHRTAHFDYNAPSDEELTAAAREVFGMLDREEEADASPG